jgi:hypothetical protein
MHGPEAVLMHVPHITATETIRRHVYERANRPLGHGPALGVGEIRDDGGRAGHRTGGNGDPNDQPGFFALVPATF